MIILIVSPWGQWCEVDKGTYRTRSTTFVRPELIINSEEWRKNLHIEEKTKNYILAYFLDEPSSHAKKALKALKEQLNCKVIALPYKFEDMDYCDEAVAAGPKEFVELVANAKVVCTDSFHGTVFALNLHTPFFTFEREYGFANKHLSVYCPFCVR